MTWTEPTTQNTGNLITANIWNNEVIGNISHVRDRTAEQWALFDDRVKFYGRYTGDEVFGTLYTTFIVADDFASLQTASLYIIPVATENYNYSVQTSYGLLGQSTTTHQTSLLNQSIQVASGQFQQIDVSAAFPNLAAGHICGMSYSRGSGSAYHVVLGLRISYLRN